MARKIDLNKIFPSKFSELKKCKTATSDEERKQNEMDYEFLCENIDLLLSNSNEILNNKKFFFCTIATANINLAYIDQMGSLIPLGVLLTLWKNGTLIEKCLSKNCKGKTYLVGVGGSPLSGMNKCWGYCSVCRRKNSISVSSLGEIIWDLYRELEEIRYQWDVVEPVSIYELVELCMNRAP